MNLHKDKQTFKNAIRAASEFLGIRDVFVEKDYWVTYALLRLNESEFSDSVVFKGGTSLSKGYKLIERFSEDIDLAILNTSNYSGAELKRLVRSVEKTIMIDFEEVDVKGITNKRGIYRKVAYEYEKTFKGLDGSGINDKIIIETSNFSNPIPFEFVEINSLIGDFFYEKGFLYRRAKYGMKNFKIKVLLPQKTLTEKLIALIRFSLADDSFDSLKLKTRHFYDIHFLCKSEYCKDYINSYEFKNDFKGLLVEDQNKFDEPKGWADKNFRTSPLFMNFDNVWQIIRNAYLISVRSLVHGEIPEEGSVVNSFKSIVEKLK